MSLRKALLRLPGDRKTEGLIRDLLQLMRVHADETLSLGDVSSRLERSELEVAKVLDELAQAYVLRKEAEGYRYNKDPVTDLDVRRFMRRADSHSHFVRSNVAKFRDRYGDR